MSTAVAASSNVAVNRRSVLSCEEHHRNQPTSPFYTSRMSPEVGPYDWRERKRNSDVSLLDRVAVANTVLNLVIRFPLWTIQGCVAPNDKGAWRQTVMSAYGYVTKSSTIPQLRILTPIKPLRVELSKATRKAKSLNNYNALLKGTMFSARWISEIPDRKPEDPVIIYFHGGGYALKMTFPQVNYIISLAQVLAQRRVSIVALDYTVTPFARYPQQLDEATALYERLSTTCQNTWLLGDSCGGNLALALAQKIYHAKLPKLSGMLLLSPWVSIEADSLANDKKDIIGQKNLKEMQEMFCDKKDLSDPLANPVKCDPEVWSKILPDKTLAVWGQYETLRNSCREWAHNIAKLQYTYEEPHGTHDCMLQDFESTSTNYILAHLNDWFIKI